MTTHASTPGQVSSRGNIGIDTAPPGFTGLWPGLLLSIAISVIAFGLGRWLPLVGGPVFGIILGVMVSNLWAPPPAACQPGIRFAGKKILQWSIVALGLGLSLTQVAQTGMESLSVT